MTVNRVIYFLLAVSSILCFKREVAFLTTVLDVRRAYFAFVLPMRK